MVKQILYLLITIIILVIIVIKVQYYFKIFEEFGKYGFTCNQCDGCPKGSERVNCGGTNTGSCSPCTGQTYKSDKSNVECQNVPPGTRPTANREDWSCLDGHYDNGDYCEICDNLTCEAGKERVNCGVSPSWNDGSCQACGTGKYNSVRSNAPCADVPVHATTSDNINWSCDAGYSKSGNSCIACIGRTYKQDSGNGECMDVPHHATTSDNINWSCDAGYSKSGNSCSACSSQSYKPASGNGECMDVPVHATTSDNINWSCDPGYYKSVNNCIACIGRTYKPDSGNGECMDVPVHATTSDNINWSCDAGYSKSGNSCIACIGRTYKQDSGNGECMDVPHHATTSDNINWSCDPGYYKSGNSCSACSPCQAGQERVNCSGTDPGSCSPCTGRTYKQFSGDAECINVPPHATTSDNINWSCDTGYYKYGNSCSECPSCLSTQYYTGSCGGTTNTKRCWGCPVCSSTQYSTGSCGGGTTNTKQCHSCPCGQKVNSTNTGCVWDNDYYLFTEYNLGGYCSKITGAVPSNDGWNRRASSFLIPPSGNLAIYNGTDCTGSCKNLMNFGPNPVTYNLSGDRASFNNAVLSIKPGKWCKWGFTPGCNY